jgi:peptide/nickel transport system substrate-binding protein
LKQVRTSDIELLQTSAIFFNAKRNAVKAPEVRKALATAVDRQAIVNEALDHTGVATDGPIPPAVPGSIQGVQPGFNLDEANRILEDAGWKRQDGSGIRKKGNDELSLSLSIVEQPDEVAVGDIIKKNWEAIGAKVELKPYDPTRIAKEVVKPRDYDAFVYGEILTPDVDLYPFWHSTQEVDPGLNLTRFFNKDADKLLDELRVEMDPAKIIEKRQAFQRLLADGNHVVFLYAPLYSYGLAKRVKGFDVNYVTVPADRFNNVSDWYVNTKISFQK